MKFVLPGEYIGEYVKLVSPEALPQITYGPCRKDVA
jgi:hypothetical protein